MKKKWIIEVDSIPQNVTVQKFISTCTDIQKHIDYFATIKIESYLSLKHGFDQQALNQEIIRAYNDSNFFSFRYSGRNSVFESYQSAALTWNPHAIDNWSANPHQSGLGSTMYDSGNSRTYEEGLAEKNTYADTYSFNQRTPLSNSANLKILLDSIKRSLVRSRISIIKGNHSESTNLQYLWHQDESIFYNLRINIPTQTNSQHVIQILEDNTPPEDQAVITEFNLLPGNAYVYNTQKFHRPCSKDVTFLDRINIICGVSPWFDYDVESNTWRSNEFYGEVHPFEMFRSGYIGSSFGQQK